MIEQMTKTILKSAPPPKKNPSLTRNTMKKKPKQRKNNGRIYQISIDEYDILYVLGYGY